MEFVKQREIQTKEITNNADQTDIVGRLTLSRPLVWPRRLPVYVARAPAAPFCETAFRSPASAAADTLHFCALLECKVQFF